MTIEEQILILERVKVHGETAATARDTAVTCMHTLLDLQKALNYRSDDIAAIYARDDFWFGVSHGYAESAKLVKNLVKEIEDGKTDIQIK